MTVRNFFGSIGNWAGGPSTPATPDQELLARFLDERDEDAFAALMRRHGPMVLGVCQRLLRNAHDAQDACQAVFLVLARQASSVRKSGSLASWLHGVAWRVANKLRTSQARRANHERAAAARKETTSEPADLSWREVLRLVDEELNRLPEAYRAPLVLCHLEGRTQDEAAKELGCSLGALRGRLERGRALLKSRLLRRGVTASAALAAVALVPDLASAALPPALVAGTAQASVPMAAGQALPAAVSAQAVTLAQAALATSVPAALSAVTAAGLCVALSVAALAFGLEAKVDPPAAPAPAAANWTEARRMGVADLRAWSVTFSPDGQRVAAGLGGFLPSPGQLWVWDAATGDEQYAIKTDRSVRCVTFSPDNQLLATAEHDNAARLRDAATGEVIHTLRGHGANLDAVTFSADGKTLATASWDGAVKLWDVATGKEVRSFFGGSGQLFSVALFDGTVAAGCVDRTIKLWNVDTGKPRSLLAGHEGPVHWLAASPDGKTLASASWDRTVRLWDPATGQNIATLKGHAQPALAVAFAPDGRTLATASGVWANAKIRPNEPGPGEVILWDVREQKARARLPHKDRVFGVAFSPDGKTLATACWDGTVALWQASPADSEKPGPEVGDLEFVPAPDLAKGDAGPALRQEYPVEFHPTLRVDKGDVEGLQIYGPDAAESVKFEPEGLRITLPATYPRQRSGTGVVTDFGVKGDFEITLSYEILEEPKPGVTGNPTDLRLVVVPAERPTPGRWLRAGQNRAGVGRESARWKDIGQFVAETTRWNNDNVPRDKWGNEMVDSIEKRVTRHLPSASKHGRLRLVRNGPTLYYFVSDGAGQGFTLLHKDEFGTKDLKNVRVLASTGWLGVPLDVRVTDLRVRAEAFPKATELALPSETPVAAAPERSWWRLLVTLSALALVGAAAVGSWLCLRARPPAAPVLPAEPVRVAGPIVFACPHCGKRLKARPEHAGGKLKCPQCGSAVAVPHTGEE